MKPYKRHVRGSIPSYSKSNTSSGLVWKEPFPKVFGRKISAARAIEGC
jgi:hypothetical protein